VYSFLLFLLKHAQKNKTLNKHLTSKLQFSPNFTPHSVADSNYRGKCDVGGFLIFEWTLQFFFCEFLVFKCILVIHCCFQNKNLSELLKNLLIPFEKFFFDSLPLKSMGLYLNLLGHFVAY
jgi:hypothetical protein